MHLLSSLSTPTHLLLFLSGGLGTHLRARLPHSLAGSRVLNSRSGGYILLSLPRAESWRELRTPEDWVEGTSNLLGYDEGIEPLYPPAKYWESWRPECLVEIDWG